MRLIILSVLGGGAALYLLWMAFAHVARRVAQREPDAALCIRPPMRRFAGFDPALREMTNKRRAAAEAIRARAAHVETGARVASILKLVNERKP